MLGAVCCGVITDRNDFKALFYEMNSSFKCYAT